ncbi:cytochrome c oxidase subunit II, partial [Vibrio astriarenae]
KRWLTIRLWIGVAAALISQPLIAESSGYNLTKGVTNISNQVYDLHMLIFYICCAIAFVVFGVMFYSIFKHRKSRGAV